MPYALNDPATSTREPASASTCPFWRLAIATRQGR
ncbi:MAG: hypothetical protein QOI43_1741, partial [Gaiellales bacterium]|nr:hypothetical protein [Gaiellales bacterium]